MGAVQSHHDALLNVAVSQMIQWDRLRVALQGRQAVSVHKLSTPVVLML